MKNGKLPTERELLAKMGRTKHSSEQLITWGFYEVLHQDDTVLKVAEVQRSVLEKAKRICEITGEDMEYGMQIIKLIPADPDDPESELMMTIGWKILLTEEQHKKLQEQEVRL